MTEHYKCNVLLVDDSCNNLAAMDNILKPIEDIGIYHALSDKEALEKIVHHDFSVVLLDANISGMDAYAFVKSLSNTDAHKHIPIVMVAEKNTSSQQDLRAYEAGAIDYITKPVDPLILQCKVKQFVAIKKLQAKNKYLQSEQEMILDVAGQGVIKICSEGTIQFVNKKTCQLMSAKSDAIIGTRLNQWFQWCDSSHCAPEDIFSYIHERVRRRGVYQQDDIKLRLESKKKVCIEITCTVEKNHSNSPMIILFQDVTARLESEQQLLNLANFDPLTHLANRSFFQDHLVRAIARARRLKSSVVLLALDLDRFKIINDTLGHDVGDELLTGVALRLKSQLRENDICARLGGDEFAVLLEDIGCVENAEEVARKIVRVIAEPFEIQGKEVLVEISIGIACCTGGQPEKRALCKWADIALYAAKAAGRNCFRRFIPTMSEKAEKQAFIQSQLRRMIENQALDIHYQAQYSLADNSIVGFEALARWPARGYGKTRVTPELLSPLLSAHV
ncbi:MAG: diguanylate cyclase [Spongiibacteraceae bacterium]|nr:diguanylate cyclase [Spongiibacteraceae bacterium]